MGFVSFFCLSLHGQISPDRKVRIDSFYSEYLHSGKFIHIKRMLDQEGDSIMLRDWPINVYDISVVNKLHIYKFLNYAKIKSDEINCKVCEGNVFHSKALIAMGKKKYNKAIQHYNEQEAFYAEHDPRRRFNGAIGRANVYYKLDDSTNLFKELNSLTNDSLYNHSGFGKAIAKLLEAGYFSNHGQTNKALNLFYEAKELSKADKAKLSHFYIYHHGSKYYEEQGQLDSSIYYARLTLDVRKRKHLAHYRLGRLYYRDGKYDTALFHANEYFKETTKIESALFYPTLLLAKIYSGLGENEQAVHLFEELLPKLKDGFQLGRAYEFLAQNYLSLGKKGIALSYIAKSESQYDEKMDAENIATLNLIKAELAMQELKPKEALQYVTIADSIFSEKQDKRDEFPLTAVKASALHLNNQEDLAELAYDQALEIAIKRDSKKDLIQIYNSLASFYEEKGNPVKAFQFMKKSVKLKDEFNSQEIQTKIKSYISLYQSSKKDKALAVKALQLEKERGLRNRWIGIALSLLVLSILVTFYMRQRAKKNLAIEQKEKALQAERIAVLEQEKKLLSMTSMIEGQEAERLRIAKDLHDGLGGLLGSVRAQLGRIEHELIKLEDMDLLKRTNSMVEEACDEVRRISHNMMPGALRLSGLREALEDLVYNLNQTHSMEVRLEFIGFKLKLDEATASFMYRIVQELSNNAIKYSGGDLLVIQLTETADELSLIVEDNGRGFEFKEDLYRTGLGLRSVKSRVDYLGGNIDIMTSGGEGCSIAIQVPKNRL